MNNNDCLNAMGWYTTSDGELQVHPCFNSDESYEKWCSYSIEEKDKMVYDIYNEYKDQPGMTKEELMTSLFGPDWEMEKVEPEDFEETFRKDLRLSN